jgi:hypothetical protein
MNPQYDLTSTQTDQIDNQKTYHYINVHNRKNHDPISLKKKYADKSKSTRMKVSQVHI